MPRLDHWLAGLAKQTSAGGVVLAGIAILALSAAAVRIGIDNDEGAFAPRAALAAAAHYPVGHVFNDINFGDYLIYTRAAAPFIDGRIDMYGDALLRRYALPGEFPELAEEYHMDWALLTPNNSHVPLLDNLPGWTRIYADKTAVVFVKETGPSGR